MHFEVHLPFWLEALVAFFLLLGAVFAFIGSIGLARLPDFYSRLHAPTKATTLGVGGMLIASMLHFSYAQGSLSVHEILVAIFLLISAPITAYMLSKVALHHQSPSVQNTQGQDLPQQLQQEWHRERIKSKTDKPKLPG
ncbi:multicomponent K+:H+ antiporter subunit G [Allopseudospirillum japonicum]|uniref:Multicomponent K+:H+ antiporter subunit G n=1 Tax=Allopseudospirillum japonicum TaxID=64971 RepID=A0A1H6QPM2_9GAMM|nr:Na+/H+ antiporter subunit G [Allopseudospirillum japonicum]SEI45513.1 multicomponent K+:H+ antiporter subunit G [Allopseudospirillum japonicum]